MLQPVRFNRCAVVPDEVLYVDAGQLLFRNGERLTGDFTDLVRSFPQAKTAAAPADTVQVGGREAA